MFRAEFGWDLYTRMCVPVEEHLTRVWYYHCTPAQDRAAAASGSAWPTPAVHRWIIEYNFSRQDERVMLNQRYDTPEKLSATDAEVIQWRRLVVTRHYGGRDAPLRVPAIPTGSIRDAVPARAACPCGISRSRRAAGAEYPAAEPDATREDGDVMPGARISRRRSSAGRSAAASALGRRGRHLGGRSAADWTAGSRRRPRRKARSSSTPSPATATSGALKSFTQAYPDIKLEHTSLHSQDFAPRILQERQANLFTWDVATIPTSTALQVLRPAGVWDPVRPAIVLPEAKDDAGWEGGFERGFAVVKDRAPRLRLRAPCAAAASPSTPIW